MDDLKRANDPLQQIFGEVAGTYELVNRVLTLGLDRPWRKAAARRPSTSPEKADLSCEEDGCEPHVLPAGCFGLSVNY
jgi:ubiquinone/menaquinone biosynthesis C-methylase UbiE